MVDLHVLQRPGSELLSTRNDERPGASSRGSPCSSSDQSDRAHTVVRVVRRRNGGRSDDGAESAMVEPSGPGRTERTVNHSLDRALELLGENVRSAGRNLGFLYLT